MNIIVIGNIQKCSYIKIECLASSPQQIKSIECVKSITYIWLLYPIQIVKEVKTKKIWAPAGLLQLKGRETWEMRKGEGLPWIGKASLQHSQGLCFLHCILYWGLSMVREQLSYSLKKLFYIRGQQTSAYESNLSHAWFCK